VRVFLGLAVSGVFETLFLDLRGVLPNDLAGRASMS